MKKEIKKERKKEINRHHIDYNKCNANVIIIVCK